jgi:hypothetical protein
VFDYAVQAGLNTPDMTLMSANFNGGVIVDYAGSATSLTSALPAISGVLQVTTTPINNTLLKSDPCTNPDPTTLWVVIAAVSPSRAQQFSSGGPNNGPYRSLTVEQGDNYYGARAQLGANDWRNSFWVYHEGDHTDTDFDIRLPSNFPMNQNLWQQVMQMKQAQPSNNGGIVSPRIELDAYNGSWHLLTDQGTKDSSGNPTSIDLWDAPAKLGQWLHVHIDAMYSQDPTKGFVNISIGSATSPTLHFSTLVPEIAGPETYFQPGQSIPACLMIGPYHASSYPTTTVDFANVQIRSFPSLAR